MCCIRRNHPGITIGECYHFFVSIAYDYKALRPVLSSCRKFRKGLDDWHGECHSVSAINTVTSYFAYLLIGSVACNFVSKVGFVSISNRLTHKLKIHYMNVASSRISPTSISKVLASCRKLALVCPTATPFTLACSVHGVQVHSTYAKET